MWGYGPGSGMMGGYGWTGPLSMIVWIIALALIVALIAWSMHARSGSTSASISIPRSTGLDLLEQRYARGEINRDEYLQKKQDLGG